MQREDSIIYWIIKDTGQNKKMAKLQQLNIIVIIIINQ